MRDSRLGQVIGRGGLARVNLYGLLVPGRHKCGDNFRVGSRFINEVVSLVLKGGGAFN